MTNKPKILIIGQAPPAVEQKVPYDTTLLYDWLSEINISKEEAQELFDFEAVIDKFPGYNKKGGHKKPSHEDMRRYYYDVLCIKIMMHPKVIVLGGVAKHFLENTPSWTQRANQILYLVHPSKRNFNLYQKNKDRILADLKKFIYDN